MKRRRTFKELGMHRWTSVAAIVALALTACGQDTNVAGPKIVGTTVDGGVSPTDGGASVNDGGDTGLCGDGVCSASESAANCPLDCKEASAIALCLKDSCGDLVTACAADGHCSGTYACAVKCDGVLCVQGCVQQGGAPSAATKALLQCGSVSSCFSKATGACGDGACDGDETPVTCPQDCKQTSSCGDGVCADGETPKTCPADCNKPTAVCGDGKCNGEENAKTCPKDCGGGAQDPLICTQKACAGAYKSCAGDGACQKIISCIQSSCDPGDGDCADECAEKIDGDNKAYAALAACSVKAGCFSQDLCGNGKCDEGEAKTCPKDCLTPSQPVCGDGKCEGPSETNFTCPKDCSGVAGLMACVSSSCPDAYAVCSKDKACKAALDCAQKCSTSDCLQKCAYSNSGAWSKWAPLVQCGQKQGCFQGGGGGGGGGGSQGKCGDGKCDYPNETPTNCSADCKKDALTCKGACGGQAKGGCWCDKQCAQFGDCCPDKDAVCGGGGGGGGGAYCGDKTCDPGEDNTNCPADCPKKPTCGDNTCDTSYGENASNCPKDCGFTPTKKPCKSKSDCSDAEVCCGQTDGNYCVPAGQCN